MTKPIYSAFYKNDKGIPAIFTVTSRRKLAVWLTYATHRDEYPITLFQDSIYLTTLTNSRVNMFELLGVKEPK